MRATATIGITGAGLSGVLRMTWVRDGLAHVLEHCESDEPSGTWTGLACPHYGLALGSDVDNAVLHRMCTEGEIADLVWEAPAALAFEHRRAFQAAMGAYQTGNSSAAEQFWQDVRTIWSQAWAANYRALELLQDSGLAGFSTAKPQSWVIASFEHHCGPHGMPQPHIHNIVVTRLAMCEPNRRKITP